jgi:MFS family permease
MDPNEPRIEIFAPFGEAFELTKKILFQPFDLAKWFVIGFAAWLATFFSGGGGFNYNRGWGKQDWNWHWKSEHIGRQFNMHNAPPWVVPAIIVGVLVFLVFLALLLWLNARGRFMFTDCIVRNRGAIVEPWREYRVEGNRYFIFQIVISICSMLIFGGLAVIYFVGSYMGHTIVPLALIILFGVAFVLIALLVALIMKLMVPVMYRQRCSAMDAFRDLWQLIVANPGVFILFCLFYILLFIAAGMIGCLAACVTCCIAALPYIGTVILLPVVMVLYAFPLCFLRQFGDPYDVWAVVRPVEPLPPPPTTPPPPPPIPPVQETPPPA